MLLRHIWEWKSLHEPIFLTVLCSIITNTLTFHIDLGWNLLIRDEKYPKLSSKIELAQLHDFHRHYLNQLLTFIDQQLAAS